MYNCASQTHTWCDWATFLVPSLCNATGFKDCLCKHWLVQNLWNFPPLYKVHVCPPPPIHIPVLSSNNPAGPDLNQLEPQPNGIFPMSPHTSLVQLLPLLSFFSNGATLTVSLSHILPSNLPPGSFNSYLVSCTNLSESPSIHLLLSSFSSPSPHKLNLLSLFYKLPAISSHPILLSLYIHYYHDGSI